MNNWTGSTILIGFTVILSACGGAGGGGSLAGGGISGTGSGTVTAIGSIVLNDRGTFQTTDSQVIIDGDDSFGANHINVGMVVKTDISDATDEELIDGDAVRVIVTHEIKGPVTRISPFEVLGQSLVITGNTVIQFDSDDGSVSDSRDLSDIPLDAEVEVSGHRDDQGVIQVSRLERKLSLSKWQIVGNISNPSGSQFTIGSQTIDFEFIIPTGCTGGLKTGTRVEVKADAPSSFTPGQILTGVTQVECKPDVLTPPVGLTGTIPAEFEGFVTTISFIDTATGVGSFTIGDQKVTISASTQYEGGTIDDLQFVGVKIDARGSYTIGASPPELKASHIRFRDTRFRLQGIVDSVSGSGSEQEITMLGLTIKKTAQTDGDIATPGNSARIEGYYIAISDELFATKIDDRGGDTDVRVRGKVQSINTVPPNKSFTVLNINIDANSVPDFDFIVNGAAVTRDNFFGALNVGDEVDVEDGLLIGNTIFNAKLEIEIEGAED